MSLLARAPLFETIELGRDASGAAIADAGAIAVQIRRSLPVALPGACGGSIRQEVRAEVCGAHVATEALLLDGHQLARTEQVLLRELYSSPLFLVQARPTGSEDAWIDADVQPIGSAAGELYLWYQPWIEIERSGVTVSGRARGLWNSRSGYFHRRLDVCDPELRLVPIPDLRVESDGPAERLFEVALVAGIQRSP